MREVLEEARQAAVGLRESLETLRKDPHGPIMFYLNAEHKFLYWDARLQELGVDTSRGLDPLYFRPGKKPPRTGKKTNELVKAATLTKQWYFVWGAGTEVILKGIGDRAWSRMLARHRWWRPAPAAPDAAADARRAFDAMADMLERFVIYQAVGFADEAPDLGVRTAASAVLAGWARSNISLAGKQGIRLRRALSPVAEAPGKLEQALREELPGAVRLAVEDSKRASVRGPREPLRSTGNKDPNLVRRIASSLEKTAKPEAEAELAAIVQDFEMKEYARVEDRVDLDALEQSTKLSPQQAAVWKQVRAGAEIGEIAAELGIPKEQVSVVKNKAIEKLTRTRKASGL